jgi:hypothetical protein
MDLEIHAVHSLDPLIPLPREQFDQEAMIDREMHLDLLRLDQRYFVHLDPPGVLVEDAAH